ncbi:MAG TPA: aminotransferase class IV [Pseudolysinimonas sp.]|nr:aminotransferase class IV [Pseudolysinimonas sp.]
MPTSALALFDFDSAGAATGYRLVDPAVPALTVTELAATRGDGVFETVGLHEGRPLKAARHFARFAISARMLDLPEQNTSVWDAALRDVAAALDPAPEGWVKMVLSRGIEGGTTPTGWAYATVAASTVSVREEGLRVVLLDRGYPSDIARTAPWLLQGAKTISYAINRAAIREAAKRDADDVVFTTSDGYLLEGPTSTLVLRSGMTLRTARTDMGILAGTTQAELFEWAARNGFSTSYDVLTRADLDAADAAWLVSSVRLAAPIRAVDGILKPVDAALTASFTAHLHSLATPAG